MLVTIAGVSVASASNGDRARIVEVDIAEDGSRSVIDEAPVFDDCIPAYGNSFVIEGYIYPAGTLTDSNGVNPDGSPELPDEVIGEWSCMGSFTGAVRTAPGPAGTVVVPQDVTVVGVEGPPEPEVPIAKRPAGSGSRTLRFSWRGPSTDDASSSPPPGAE